jgi:hypothetical protein
MTDFFHASPQSLKSNNGIVFPVGHNHSFQIYPSLEFTYFPINRRYKIYILRALGGTR